MGLDQDESPGEQSRKPVLMLTVLMLGLVICGAVNVHMSYRHNAPANGAPPLNSFGQRATNGAQNSVRKFDQDQFHPLRIYDQRLHILFGAVVAGGLQYACMTIPKWPLHPIGLLVVKNYYGDSALASVFFGWLIKVLVLRYGGGRLYRRGQPLFLGLTVGEVLAVVFWGMVSGSIAAAGLQFEAIHLQPM